MSLSTADTIFLCVGVIDFGGIFIWFGFALHLAYTRLDEMLERLKNCQAITRCVSLGHRGLYGKILLIGGISSIVTFPGMYKRCGGVSTEDLNALPDHLKRRLVVMQWALLGLLALLLLLFIFGKYTGVID